MPRRATIEWLLICVIGIGCIVVGAEQLREPLKRRFFGGSARSKVTATLRALPIVPVTVVFQETIHIPPEQHKGGVYTRAVRSDGSYVHWSDLPRNRRSVRELFLVVPNEADVTAFVVIDELRGMKSTSYEKAEQYPVRDAALGCLLPWSDGNSRGEISADHQEEILGYKVLRVERPSIDVSWYAPQLGCAALKAQHYLPRQTNVQEAIEVVPGEPEPALFEASRFEEVRPSVLHNITDKARASRLDQRYLSRKRGQ